MIKTMYVDTSIHDLTVKPKKKTKNERPTILQYKTACLYWRKFQPL